MKKKVKPTSIRFDNELLDELDQRCSKVGCSRNDFIKNSVDFIINQYSDFDFGDDEEVEEVQQQEPIVTEVIDVPEIKHGKIFNDEGKLVGTF